MECLEYHTIPHMFSNFEGGQTDTNANRQGEQAVCAKYVYKDIAAQQRTESLEDELAKRKARKAAF